jgi:predicted branched-subunit amino acid permease
MTPPATERQALWRGVLQILPISLGIIPFGLVTGIAGVSAGLSVAQITFMSAVVYAGAAQLVSLQLIGAGAGVPFVLLALVVVNLRYVMYSSALAKPFAGLTPRLKALAAFLMVDQNFALMMGQYEALGPRLAPWLYLGAGAVLWSVWVVSSYAGALLGAKVPEGWSLDFAVPLCFLVLMVPAVQNRPSLFAALVGGLVATALVGLPYRSGLFIGAIAGIVAGVWLENRGKQ